MFEQVVDLLVQTFCPVGENATETIEQATNILVSLNSDENFYHTLFEIIISNSKWSIRASAANFLNYMIINYWDQELPANIKGYIINNYIEMLLQSNLDLNKVMMNTTRSLVNHAYFQNEWPDLLQIIINIMNTNTRIALILTKSISYHFQTLNEDDEHLYISIQDIILPNLTEIISNTQDYLILALCYQIARRLSIPCLPPYFARNINILSSWISFALPLMIQESDDANFLNFVRSIIKFCSIYFYKQNEILDQQVAIEAMNTIIQVTTSGVPSKILGRCAQFIDHALHYEPTWSSIEGDIDSFIKYVILPFFALSNEDIENSEIDPAKFILDFHGQSTDTSDPRAFLYKKISLICKLKRHTSNLQQGQVLTAGFERLLAVILPCRSPEYNSITFSVCLLYSTTSSNVDPNSCYNIVPLLSDESHLVRSAGLVAIKYMNYPAEIFMQILPMLEDPSILVQYYAATAISHFFGRAEESPQTADEIREYCNDFTLPILTSYFNLIQEFNDDELIELIKKLVSLFSHQLASISTDFVINVYSIFLQFSKDDHLSGIIISALSSFLSLISEHQESDEAISILLDNIYKSFNELSIPAAKKACDLLTNIVAYSPTITEKHWLGIQVVHEAQDLLFYEACLFYRNLILRDRETARIQGVYLLNMAISQINATDIELLCPAISFLVALFIVLEGLGGGDFINNLLNLIKEIINIPNTQPYAAQLLASMIIFDASYTLNAMGNERELFLNDWINSCKYQELLATIVKCYGSFTDQESTVMISKLIEILIVEHDKLQNSIFSQDLEEQMLEKSLLSAIHLEALEIFQEASLIQSFSEFLNNIVTHDPRFQEKFGSMDIASIQELLNEMYHMLNKNA